MNRKISAGVTAALVLVAMTITFTATMIFAMRLYDSKILNVKEREAMYAKLSEVDSIIRQNFYFEVDEQRLYDAIANGYVNGVGDPDSLYLTQQQVLGRTEETAGTEVSAGFEAARDAAGYITVAKLYPGMSAAQLGLLENDTIVKVAGQDVLEVGYDAAVDLLRGTAGSKVSVAYSRDGVEIEEELTREIREIDLVLPTMLDNICYIRIRAFKTPTESQFEEAMNAVLANSECRGVIFDLRGVDGGYNIDFIASMLDILLPTGTIISGDYGDGSTKVLYTSDEESISMPMVVLVDGGTKGFSELFAGVLGDAENCRVVGAATFGKGTLQSLSMLSDGSALDLTIAVLQTPVSGSFNGTGIVPDYEVLPSGEYADADAAPDPLRDAQLQKAVEVVGSIR